MNHDNDSKTFYNGKASDDFKNEAEIPCTPRTNKEGRREWQKEIINKIHDLIDVEKSLDPIGDRHCHIYLTFCVANAADVDNLQKRFIDALYWSNNDNAVSHQFVGKKFLLKDDSFIKGVEAQREIIRHGNSCVKLKYLITKTFKIDNVHEIEGRELKEYRSYWSDPMQLITAREIIDGKEGKEVKLIDNACGSAFVTQKTKNIFPKVIPGYNWKEKEKQIVEGCMVFNREHSKREKADWKKEKSFWWIKRLPDSF